jgi:hypothetical protein
MPLALALAVSARACAASMPPGEADVRAALAKPMMPVKDWLVWGETYKEVLAADEAAEKAWLACRDGNALARRQRTVREALLASFGGFPERTPLNVRTVRRVARDGYSIEFLVFESMPGVFVTAHLFLPDPARFPGRRPGVLVPCGHSDAGKAAPLYQRVSLQCAKAGFAALVYDPVDQGERRQQRALPKVWNGPAHNHVGHRAMLLGWATGRFRIWDAMRAMDVLAARGEVDPARLGVMGHSGGGTLSSYMAALDDRVRCAAPSGYLTNLGAVALARGPQDGEQNFFGQLSYGFNHLGCVLLRAPSPFLQVNTHRDFFPFHGSAATRRDAAEVYAAIGESGRYAFIDAPGPHSWPESSRAASIDWMKRFLMGDESVPRPGDPSYRALDYGFDAAAADFGLSRAGTNANVTATGCVLDLPGARSVYDVMRDELARLDSARPRVVPDAVRAVAGVRPLAEIPRPAVCGEETSGGLRRAVLLVDGAIPLATVSCLRPRGEPVLLISDSPRRESLAPRFAALLADGRSVMAAELRVFGESSAMPHREYRSHEGDDEIACMYYWLGRNLAGARTEDVLVCARELSERCGGAPVRIVAEGRASVPAAHARFLEPELVASLETVDPPPSWRAVVSDVSLRTTYADCVQGALRVYDWTDLNP